MQKGKEEKGTEKEEEKRSESETQNRIFLLEASMLRGPPSREHFVKEVKGGKG